MCSTALLNDEYDRDPEIFLLAGKHDQFYPKNVCFVSESLVSERQNRGKKSCCSDRDRIFTMSSNATSGVHVSGGAESNVI